MKLDNICLDPKGFLMVGGWTNQKTKTAGLFIPNSDSYCRLPPLKPARNLHSLTGFTACGGWGTGDTCSTFNTSTGNWELSYKYALKHETHVAWKHSQVKTNIFSCEKSSSISYNLWFLWVETNYRDDLS